MDLSAIGTRFSCVIRGFARTFRATKLARRSLASGRAWLIPLLCLPLPATSERGMEIRAERPEKPTTLDAFVTHTSRVNACTLTSVDLFLSRAYTLTLVSVHLFCRERKLINTVLGDSKRALRRLKIHSGRNKASLCSPFIHKRLASSAL